MTLTITPFKILICLIIALLTAFIFRIVLGDKRDLYFKQSNYRSLITFRGAIGRKVAIGVPKNKRGVQIYLTLIILLALEILFVMWI